MRVSPYHLRTSDLHNFPLARSKSSLTTDHVSAIAEHEDTDKGIAISVPVDNWLVILLRMASDSFDGITSCLLNSNCKPPIFLLFSVHGDVDVTNLKVHFRDKINTSDFGDDGQCLRVLPCIIDKRCITVMVSELLIIWFMICLLCCEASELALR